MQVHSTEAPSNYLVYSGTALNCFLLLLLFLFCDSDKIFFERKV